MTFVFFIKSIFISLAKKQIYSFHSFASSIEIFFNIFI